MSTPSLSERVAEARSRSGVGPTDSAGDRGAEVVQFAVRVPAGLRHVIHRAARAAGAPSTQQWVVEVLTKAAIEADDLSRVLHARYLVELSERVAAKIEDGSYEEFAAAFDDPELS